MKRLLSIILIAIMLTWGNAFAVDQTIKAAEEMVGSGHATKADTLNRLSLVEHNTDGTHKTTIAAKLQSVAATVGSSALTLGLNPCVLDFRSATLTTGVPTTRTISSALSLVVPSGATLGTVDAVAARLALLAIDNAGTIELAVVNLSGGNNLDETTLITTTAISTASDTANVIFSTTARTDVPFRVVGFIDITEATAGTWATAPTRVQGGGGQALATLSTGFGYGQTWQDVKASRTSGTTYYNTTGKPIVVLYTAVFTSASIVVGGVTIAAPATTQAMTLTFVVPPGQSYVITNTGAVTNWTELR